MSENKKSGAESLRASRRGFFKAAGVATAAVGALAGEAAAGTLPAPKASLKTWKGGKFPKAPVMAKGRVLGANDRINIAHIGVGGMGRGHVGNFKVNNMAPGDLSPDQKKKRFGANAWNTQSIAVSDVYTRNMDRAKEIILGNNPEGQSVQMEKDYRKILENKDVDAVIIATPEHWHAQIAVHAMEAGKHVYCEKPATRYIDEVFQMYDTWKKTGRIVQVGSQGCSDPKYHAAREVVASGKLGPIISAQSSYTRNAGTKGEWNYTIEEEANPENLDWGMWLGSAPKRPWNEDSKARFFRYRKYRDYSAGILGDLMPHRIHPLLFTMGAKDWPLKVQAIGTMKVSTDREVADSVTVMAEMESGWTFLFVGSTVNEQGLPEVVRGHKATMYMANKPDVKPERPYVEEIEGGLVEVADAGESHPKHEYNWIESMRANKQPNCDMELSVRTQVLVSLAEISEVQKRTVAFDPAKRSWKFA